MFWRKPLLFQDQMRKKSNSVESGLPLFCTEVALGGYKSETIALLQELRRVLAVLVWTEW